MRYRTGTILIKNTPTGTASRGYKGLQGWPTARDGTASLPMQTAPSALALCNMHK